MLRLVIASALLALVVADVSHLFNKQPSRFGGATYSQPRPVGVAPVAHHQSQNEGSILKQHSDMSADGSYQYGYETDNGITHEEAAVVKQTGHENAAKSAQGSYSYTSPEGVVVQMSYLADENGFQPVGSHIPTSPPIPEAILRALAYIEAHSADQPKKYTQPKQYTQPQQYNQPPQQYNQPPQKYNQPPQPFGRQQNYYG